MDYHKTLKIGIEDFFSLVVRLIADDLKIHKHFYYLSLSGVDTTPLRLHLHEVVFRMVGISKEEITEEIEEWYFRQAERVFEIDPVQDPKALLELSVEILTGLNQLQSELSNKHAS